MDAKILANQAVQIDAAGDDVTAKGGGRGVRSGERQKRGAKLFVDFGSEEGDLALVVGFVVKKSVTAHPASGYTLKRGHGEDRVFASRLLMVAEVIVASGKVEVFEADHAVGQNGIIAYEPHEMGRMGRMTWRGGLFVSFSVFRGLPAVKVF